MESKSQHDSPELDHLETTTAWRSQSRVADPKKALRSAMQQILR